MAGRPVWYQFYGAFSPVQAILEGLAKAGLTISQKVEGNGIVSFHEVDAGLIGLLREMSGSGFRRLVAVALQPDRLSVADRWRLLQAGAADVISWERSENSASQIAARFERWNAVDD